MLTKSLSFLMGPSEKILLWALNLMMQNFKKYLNYVNCISIFKSWIMEIKH